VQQRAYGVVGNTMRVFVEN